MLATITALALSSGFYSGGRFQPLELPDVARFESRLGPRERRQWTHLRRRPEPGRPVLFGHPSDDVRAFGVLTRVVVLGTYGCDPRPLLTAIAGFRAAKPSAVAAHQWTATFETPEAGLAGANELYGKPCIAFAHPDFVLPKVFRDAGGDDSARDEPYYDSQWHLPLIAAEAAWRAVPSAAHARIAVLDGGFEVSHPDLAGAWDHNLGEVPDNGSDDDGNGLVDDVLGWNFSDRRADLAGLFDDHGTAVAGLAGARLNREGVAGACPMCSLIPIAVAWNAASDAEAFYYAARRGADVITCSWGYELRAPLTDAVVEAIKYVARYGRSDRGSVVLFAMSNVDRDDCAGDAPDISSLSEVLAVSAADDQDLKVPYSASGPCMDVLGPTEGPGRPGMATTDLTGNRGYNRRGDHDLADEAYTSKFGGTSAATPVAASIAALAIMTRPELTASEVMDVLRCSAEKIASDRAGYDERGFSATYGYGRVNAAAAVRQAARGRCTIDGLP